MGRDADHGDLFTATQEDTHVYFFWRWMRFSEVWSSMLPGIHTPFPSRSEPAKCCKNIGQS